jgi:hypothetical protein
MAFLLDLTPHTKYKYKYNPLINSLNYKRLYKD